MYYFDNVFLQQYIDQGVELWVFDGYQWHEIADKSDLTSPKEGFGYDQSGRGHKFDYRSISQIKVNNDIFTLDQLQSKLSGKGEDDKSAEAKPKPEGGEEPDAGGPPPEEEPSDEESSAKREPDLSHFSPVYDIGRELINEWRKRNAIKH